MFEIFVWNFTIFEKKKTIQTTVTLCRFKFFGRQIRRRPKKIMSLRRQQLQMAFDNTWSHIFVYVNFFPVVIKMWPSTDVLENDDLEKNTNFDLERAKKKSNQTFESFRTELVRVLVTLGLTLRFLYLYLVVPLQHVWYMASQDRPSNLGDQVLNDHFVSTKAQTRVFWTFAPIIDCDTEKKFRDEKIVPSIFSTIY